MHLIVENIIGLNQIQHKVFQEENNILTLQQGRIEVICGSMFSGKTEELIRRLKRARIAQQRVEIYKPALDTRYSDVDSARSILLLASNAQVVGIDEAQFFDDSIVEVVNELADSGKRVIIAGLDMDFKGNPFGPMPKLMAIAEDVTKVHAICVKCGNLAHVSHRIVKAEQQVLLGEKDEYEPLCRCCYNKAEHKD